jgi:hypothetical protein
MNIRKFELVVPADTVDHVPQNVDSEFWFAYSEVIQLALKFPARNLNSSYIWAYVAAAVLSLA